MKRPLATYRPFGPFVGDVDVPTGFFSNETDDEFDISTDEETIRIYTPTESPVSDSQASDIESKVMSMLDDEVTVKPVKSGVLSNYMGARTELPHETLDILEANIKRRAELESRSTVMGINTDKTLHSVFDINSGMLTESNIAKINELGSFVTEIDLDVLNQSNELMIDSGKESMGHTDIDVIEILSSRTAFGVNASLSNNKLVLR
jgi:hypothetical protein